MLKTSHYISEAYAWFGAAYFLYDIWSMYVVHVSALVVVKKNGRISKFCDYLIKNPIIVVHHVFIGGFGFLFITVSHVGEKQQTNATGNVFCFLQYLRGGLGDCFFGFVYLMEASTPFVSLRGVLSKIGLKTSKIYVVNGLLMLLVFFLCRVAMFPYVIYLYAKSAGLGYFAVSQLVLVFIVQLYFFFSLLGD